MVIALEVSRGCVCVVGLPFLGSAAATPFALAPTALAVIASRVWGGFVLRVVVSDRVCTWWLAKGLRLRDDLERLQGEVRDRSGTLGVGLRMGYVGRLRL